MYRVICIRWDAFMRLQKCETPTMRNSSLIYSFFAAVYRFPSLPFETVDLCRPVPFAPVFLFFDSHHTKIKAYSHKLTIAPPHTKLQAQAAPQGRVAAHLQV
jgi:hypothetical protein